MRDCNSIAERVLSPGTRRQFLSTAGALLAGAAVAQAEPSFSHAAEGCYLGFSTYGMKSLKTEDALREVARIGFDAVELTVREGWDADSAKVSADRRAQLRKQLDGSPLTLTSLMEHVPPTSDKLHAFAKERLKLASQLSNELAPSNPPLVQTVLGGGDFDKLKTTLVDRLGEWVEIADQREIVLCIKPHRGGCVSQPAEAIWLWEQLGKPARLRMVYDFSHYAFRGLTIADTVEAALPMTSHIAVKDAVKTEGGKVRFELPGHAGTIDFSEILKRFYEGGFRADINCEVSGMVWGQKGYDPIAAAETCFKNMAAAFQKARVPRR